MSFEERARYAARQGHASATSDGVRVVEQGDNITELRDVPADGTTVGEIITRGNLVMKGVSVHNIVSTQRLTCRLVFPRSRSYEEGIQRR
jgi:hypothetical protein